jgi:DMSO/TMAO reductase YedYZ molybdopterin-dependent catalytic subunit
MTLDIFRRTGRDRESTNDRVPPGQRLTERFPVLTHGGTPHIDMQEWKLIVTGAVEEELILTWEELCALPQTTSAADIHCVTGWSRLDDEWQGVSFRELMRHVRPKPEAKHVMAHSYGGYTSNVPLQDLMEEGVLLARSHNGEPLTPEHGGPLRLVIPHLYFWKSAKWLRGFQFMADEHPGFWERYGYHIRGDPWKEERYS